MADISINLSEQAKKFRKIYFPKGGEFGAISKLMNELFIEHCKKRETIEFHNNEIEESKIIIEQQKKIIEESNIRIKMIKSKESDDIFTSWEYIKSNKPKIKDFLLESVKIRDKGNFDIEARIKAFNNEFNQNIKEKYYTKILNHIKNEMPNSKL